LNPANLLNSVIKGTKLTPLVRKQMLENTIALYNARARYGNQILDTKFAPLAKQYGLSLEQL
jgi:hypothetical protein